MKIIILNLGDWKFDETSLNQIGLGGSETWAIQLADAFVRKKHDVSVLCNCSPHIAWNGVKYIPHSELDNIVVNNKYDLCIISRFFSNIMSPIEYYHMSENVFLQAHDNRVFSLDDINQITQLKCFKGICTLSGYQERCIHDNNGIGWDYMFRIGNGIDPQLFENIDCIPTNKNLLFSSDYRRGCNIIYESILPKLNGIVADCCSYLTNSSENVNFIGSLNKHDLYTQMGNRFYWFYPCSVNETFCITALENIMCENDLILPINSGLITVLEPFINDITMKHTFTNGNEEYDLAVDEAVERINTSINNHEQGKELRAELKNYVLNKYTWDIIADKWLKLI